MGPRRFSAGRGRRTPAAPGSAAIARMEESRIFEDEQLHRLKKKKLFLKDQIVSLEHKLDGQTTH